MTRTTIELEAQRIVDTLRARIVVEEVLTPVASPIPALLAGASRSLVAANRRPLLTDQRTKRRAA